MERVKGLRASRERSSGLRRTRIPSNDKQQEQQQATNKNSELEQPLLLLLCLVAEAPRRLADLPFASAS